MQWFCVLIQSVVLTFSSSIINVEKYPLDPSSAGYKDLVAECRNQLNARGYVHLSNFVFENVAKSMAHEAMQLAERPGTFKSFEEHNIFLRDEPNLDALDPEHPRRVKQQSSKTVVSARDIPSTSELSQLFSNQLLQKFVQSVLEEEALFESADPVGKFYYNIFSPGDALGWHFDNSLFSVSLILQPCEAGGDFRYWPDSRQQVEAWTTWQPQLAQGHALVPRQGAGTLYIFRGHQALHSVSPVQEGVRVNAIFTFNSQPGVALSSYARKKFFGVEELECKA